VSSREALPPVNIIFGAQSSTGDSKMAFFSFHVGISKYICENRPFFLDVCPVPGSHLNLAQFFLISPFPMMAEMRDDASGATMVHPLSLSIHCKHSTPMQQHHDHFEISRSS